MQHLIFLLIAYSFSGVAKAQKFQTPFEKGNGNQSATYSEAIAFYRELDKSFSEIDIQVAGASDMADPLHVVFYSRDGDFNFQNWKEQQKIVLLINNGIHPGEPDGIDASMMLLRDAASGRIKVPENIVLAVIPVFNIGGALNRGSYSRANQNGPQAYGFRGNARNLDLNRDFIKMDARETQSLVKLFHSLDPDIFIDNHVSNGADYQHVMTLLSSNSQKLGYFMGRYLKNILEPELYKTMKKMGYDLVPYVNHWGGTPDKGWTQFYDSPRFTSGFAALFQTFAFVPETHMLKPYAQRVKATYDLMNAFILIASENSAEIKTARETERKFIAEANTLPVDWKVDSSRFSTIPFKGYEGKYSLSKVSGKKRLYYDRNQPYTKEIPFYNYFIAVKQVDVPQAYIIPQGWHQVIRKMKINGVEMERLKKDTVLSLSVYRIENYATSSKPYEGHYVHSKLVYTGHKEDIRLLKGDFIIPLRQKAKRYLVETLEPDAPDAFFSWGFFDAILQRKEHFSDYVFEEDAAELLKKDKHLNKIFQERKKSDAAFSENPRAQLEFIYNHSFWSEPEYLRYPVFRLD